MLFGLWLTVVGVRILGRFGALLSPPFAKPYLLPRQIIPFGKRKVWFGGAKRDVLATG